MNKNLKKVISAVAALALSVTSFVAMASYPDVASTDKHASAINELSALGIITGFEDGSFHPDELVTRAQMAAMVVRALNVANAESNKVQMFNDVDADNWAAGWVATAASQGIINGTGNNNFDPDLNVTYAQTAKMLVAACGYDDWAMSRGGWPSGYLMYAGTTGITNNISGVSNDTAITRAQAAQMIANALEAAILDTVSMSTDYQGNLVELKNVFDGSTDERSPYKTLLSTKWNAYVVNGKVTETPKSNDSLKDKVKYTIDRARNFDGESVGYSSVRPVGPTTLSVDAKIGTSGADNYLNEYTKAIIAIDDYEEKTVVYIEGSAKSDTVSLETNLFSGKTVSGSRQYLEFYRSASTQSTTRYELSTAADNGGEWKLIVNNVEVAATDANLAFYMNQTDNNPNAKVVLSDNPSAGSTDGKYDVVSVTYGVTAVVDSISNRSSEIVVSFKDQTSVGNAPYGRVASKMNIAKDDDSKTYTFIKDGKAINVTDLNENDVLTILFNVESGFADSTFYDVTVSEAKVEGTISQSGKNEYDQNYYSIGGTNYVEATGMSLSNLVIGSTYTVYLTAAGEIAYCDKTATSISYAIVDRVFTATSGEEKAMVIGKDGIRREYEIDTNSDMAVINAVRAASANATTAQAYANLPVDQRLVDYTITSSNKLRVKSGSTIVAGSFLGAANAKKYTASTSRLGSYLIGDASIILDMSDVIIGDSTTAGVVSKSDFVDGVEYEGVVARDQSASAADAYPFIIITNGFGGISVDTQMAVVNKVMQTTADGADRTLLGLYVNGELTEKMCEDSGAPYSTLAEGEVIIYTTDTDGYIDELISVFKNGFDPINITNKYGYLKQIAENGPVANIAAGIANQSAKIVSNNADLFPVRDGDAVEYVFGPVLEKSTSSITIGAVGYGQIGNKTNTTGLSAYFANITGETYAYEADAKVYTYTGENKAGYKVANDNAGSVAKSTITNANATTTSYLDADGTMINLGMEGENATNSSPNTIAFALLRVFDDRVQEVYSITMPDDDYKSVFVGLN